MKERHTTPERPRDAVSSQDARGGEIILRTRRRRWIFIGGLVAFVAFVLVLQLIGLGA